jgi:hypothetical protein
MAEPIEAFRAKPGEYFLAAETVSIGDRFKVHDAIYEVTTEPSKWGAAWVADVHRDRGPQAWQRVPRHAPHRTEGRRMTEPRKITFHPDVAAQFVARPFPYDVPRCECGCEDIEREPFGDLTYYVEPEPPKFLETPGVTSAWFLLEGEYLPVAIMTMGDGKGNVMRRDL